MRAMMNRSVRDSLVSGYERFIESVVLPDPDDRHVVATAIHCSSEAIITFNMKDLPEAALRQVVDGGNQNHPHVLPTLGTSAPLAVQLIPQLLQDTLR